MKNSVQVVLVLLVVAVLSTFSQTSADFHRQFGTPLEAYEVQPNILMTVYYDGEGNVSVVTFTAKHADDMTVSSRNSFSYTGTLPSADIKALLLKIAPDSVRGKPGSRVSFNSSCNGIYTEEFQYISIHYAAACDGLYSVQVRWKKR
jgi:hypothetical protein